MIKKGIYLLWGLWCAFITLITPVWLTLTYLNLSGEIYKYDYTMAEGTAIVFGIVMVVVWLLVGLLPCVLLVKQFYKTKRKYAYTSLILVAIILVVSMTFCGWDVMDYLTTKNFL